jgi:hypothetical protein
MMNGKQYLQPTVTRVFDRVVEAVEAVVDDLRHQVRL